MGSIKIGNNNVTDVKFGNNQVTKVYLGTNLIWTGGTVSSYSAELTAIIARANLEGFTLPSAATLTACDNLITAMKANYDSSVGSTYWNQQDRFYNFAYNNTALTNFSRIDWKNPATSPLLTVGGGIAYQTAGFLGNGVDGYLDTNFIPSVDGVKYQDYYASRIAFIYTLGSNTRIDGNSTNPFDNAFVALDNYGGWRINRASNPNLPNENIGGSGLKGIHQVGSTGYISNRSYISGGHAFTGGILPTTSQFILRQLTGYGNNLVSMYSLGGYLFNGSNGTSPITLTFRNDYNTYLSAIGLVPNTDA